MKKLLKVSGLVGVLLLLLTGCGVAPIYNVQNSAIQVKSNTTNNDVYHAIKKAGISLGWIISKVKDGEAKAVLNIRTHQAIVKIVYNNKNYSIIYVSSVNLRYNATKNTIHSNYNGWIQNLKRAIDVQLSAYSD